MLVAQAKRRIHAPSEMVYELLADLERLPDHDCRARRVEVLDAAASRVRVTGRLACWPYRAEFAVTRWPGLGCRHETVAGAACRVSCRCYVQITEGFTELVHVEELDLPAPWSSLERWLRPFVQRAIDREVDRVKAMVESALVARLRESESFSRP